MSLNPYKPTPSVRIEHAAWSKNATIYQINTRHFTEEGTFRAAEKHLPRLVFGAKPSGRPVAGLPRPSEWRLCERLFNL